MLSTTLFANIKKNSAPGGITYIYIYMAGVTGNSVARKFCRSRQYFLGNSVARFYQRDSIS